MRKLIVAIALLSLLAPAGVLAAKKGPAGKYKGNSEQNRPVTFKIAKGKVKNFEGGINIFCIGQGLEFNAAIPPKAMKLNGKKFSYEGPDKSDSTNIKISGTLKKGAKVKGKITMTDSRYDSYNQTFSSCSGTAKFTAKRQ